MSIISVSLFNLQSFINTRVTDVKVDYAGTAPRWRYVSYCLAVLRMMAVSMLIPFARHLH